MRFDMPTGSPALLNVAGDLIITLGSGSIGPAKAIPFNGVLLHS